MLFNNVISFIYSYTAFIINIYFYGGPSHPCFNYLIVIFFFLVTTLEAFFPQIF